MAEADGVKALDVADTHQSRCSDCRSWIRSTKQQIQVLLELPELEAPEELDELVNQAILSPPSRPEESDERTRSEEAIRAALPRKAAPEELEQRVAASLMKDVERRAGNRGDGLRTVQSVRVLDIEPVPNVLERLIDEELAAPAAHRVDRMVGNLEPRRAPETLAARVARRLRPRSLPKLVVAPLATLLAACLLIWVAFHRDEPKPKGYAFTVVHAEDAKRLDPTARLVAEALSGGAASAVREVRRK